MLLYVVSNSTAVHTEVLDGIKYALHSFSSCTRGCGNCMHTWPLKNDFSIIVGYLMHNMSINKHLITFISSYCVAGQFDPLSIFKLLEILVKWFISSWNLGSFSHFESRMCMQTFCFEKASRIFAAMIVCNVTYIGFHAFRQKSTLWKAEKSQIKKLKKVWLFLFIYLFRIFRIKILRNPFYPQKGLKTRHKKMQRVFIPCINSNYSNLNKSNK